MTAKKTPTPDKKNTGDKPAVKKPVENNITDMQKKQRAVLRQVKKLIPAKK